MEIVPPSFKLRKTCIPLVESMFKKYLEPTINFMRKNLPEPV